MPDDNMSPPPDERLLTLASWIDEGREVDWDEASRASRDEDERAIVEELRLLADVARVCRDPDSIISQDISEPLADSAPEHWGGLVLLDAIGRGAFATVYRAHDNLQREVALKLFDAPRRGGAGSSAQADARQRAERTRREGMLLARVKHPNIVTIHGADEHEGRAGLWMEFIHGRTLETELATRGTFSAQEAALLGRDLCRALAAVHGAGLLHRDVKAHNVMRETGGRIVLMDFGAGTELTTRTRRGMRDLAGTPLYLAPELFAGASASPASDIYSLGVLLFHLVTGKYPVDGATRADIEAAHTRHQRTRLRDARPDLPDAFVQVIERAVGPSAAQRFQTAGELDEALARACGLPVALPTPSSSAGAAGSDSERRAAAASWEMELAARAAAAINGTPVSGSPANGASVSGPSSNGLSVNGRPHNGAPIDGQPSNGLSGDGRVTGTGTGIRTVPERLMAGAVTVSDAAAAHAHADAQLHDYGHGQGQGTAYDGHPASSDVPRQPPLPDEQRTSLAGATLPAPAAAAVAASADRGAATVSWWRRIPRWSVAAVAALAIGSVAWPFLRPAQTPASRDAVTQASVGGGAAAAPPASGAASPAAGSAAGAGALPVDVAGAASFSVRASLYRQVGDRKVDLADGDPVGPGDDLGLRLWSTRPLYTYVVNRDDRGEAYLLFPLKGHEKANPLPAGELHELPGARQGAEHLWVVTSRGGREHFLIFADTQPVPEFDELLRGLPAPQPGKPIRYAALPAAMVGRLRGVGGVAPAPGGPTRQVNALFATAQPLRREAETVSGPWLRQITFKNPVDGGTP